MLKLRGALGERAGGHSRAVVDGRRRHGQGGGWESCDVP